MNGEEEHPDLLACRPCRLLFAPALDLKDHQIRGCPVNEPPAKRCKREDDGVEGTYGYELECYLKDRVLRRPTPHPSPEFRRQHGLLRSRKDTLGGISFHFPKEGPAEFFDSIGRAPET